jgi:hypothetical protein
MADFILFADFPQLFADLEDWIWVIGFLFFVLGPILNAIGGGQNKQAQPKQQPRRVPPVQQPGRPGVPPQQQPRGQAGRGRQALENEIEEFLRRAGKPQRPAEREKPARQQRPQRQQPAARQQQAPPKKRVTLEQRRLNKEAKERKVARQEQVKQAADQKRRNSRRPLGDGVGQHVREHIESHPVSEHSKDLGKLIGQADEKVEKHLHDVFDHKLGALEKDDVFQETQGTDSAVWDKRVVVDPGAKIRQLLKNRESVRHAIILTEVFKRPVGLD